MSGLDVLTRKHLEAYKDHKSAPLLTRQQNAI